MAHACAQRLLAGAIDGSSGHEKVGPALRALLAAARAQLDKQVEVRMRQAAARSASRQSAGGAGARRDLSAGGSPAVNGRGRLDF